MKSNDTIRVLPSVISAVLMGSTALVSFPLVAQENFLEEIIVTAQKRQQSLQDVPLAVTAFDAKSLEESGFEDVTDLATQVPNLQISALFGTSNPKIFMRGIGNNSFNQTAQSKVAVYVDQVYLSAASGQLFQMFDLERIEVLRGPQGTLYGKNTTGGAISVMSKAPGEEFGGHLKASFGNYSAFNTEGAVNIPLSDQLSSRISFTTKNRDGYLTDLGSGNKVNDADNYAWRTSFKYSPTDNQEYLLNIHGGESDSTHNNSEHRGLFDPDQLSLGNIQRLSPAQVVARQGVDLLGYADPDSDPYRNTYGTDTFAEIELIGASLTGNIEFENGYMLTSVTGAEESKRHVLQEGNGAPSTVFTIDWGPSEFSQFSQEIRLTSPTDSDLRWIVGAFYFEEEGDVNNFYNLSDLAFSLGFQAFDQFYTQDTLGYAGFGQIVYDINDELTLTLGGRLSYEERDLDHTTYIGDDNRNHTLALVNADLTEDWSEWSGQVALDYKPNEQMTLYGSVSRGFTAGGFNTGAFNDPVGALEVFDPEILLSYEIGAKTEWFQRKLRLNAAAFYYDYSDLQVFTFNESGLQFIENASDAEVSGIELELTALPIPELEISASLGLMNSEYKDFSTSQGDLSGNQLIGSPEKQFNTVIQYTQDIPVGSLIYRTDVTYTGNRFYDENERFDLSSEGGDTVVNVKVSYLNHEENLQLSLWSNNVTDEVIIIDAVDVGAFGYQNVWYNMPRTYGLDIIYRFQ